MKKPRDPSAVGLFVTFCAFSAEDGGEVLFRGGDGGDGVLFCQQGQDVGRDEGRQGGAQADITDTQVQER